MSRTDKKDYNTTQQFKGLESTGQVPMMESTTQIPKMVEVDVSTSSVLSDHRGSAAAANAGDNMPSVLSDTGTAPSPGEALRAASLEAAQ